MNEKVRIRWRAGGYMSNHKMLHSVRVCVWARESMCAREEALTPRAAFIGAHREGGPLLSALRAAVLRAALCGVADAREQRQRLVLDEDEQLGELAAVAPREHVRARPDARTHAHAHTRTHAHSRRETHT
eukprot:3432234-Pleurochrysis_carterae.AAC.3